MDVPAVMKASAIQERDNCFFMFICILLLAALAAVVNVRAHIVPVVPIA
jgi:hypothetical protein